jgi:hypothetical protein
MGTCVFLAETFEIRSHSKMLKLYAEFIEVGTEINKDLQSW